MTTFTAAEKIATAVAGAATAFALGVLSAGQFTAEPAPTPTPTSKVAAQYDAGYGDGMADGYQQGLAVVAEGLDARIAEARQAGQDYADEAWRQALLECQEDEAFTAERECVAMDDADFTAAEGWVAR